MSTTPTNEQPSSLPVGSPSELGLNFSSPAFKRTFVASRAAKYKEGGMSEEAAMARADRDWDVHLRTVLIPDAVRNALADALKGLPDQQKEHLKKAGNDLIDLLKQGGMADVANNQKALDDVRSAFRHHQDDVIKRAIAAGASPYEAMAGLANLGVFFGGIASFIGNATGNQGWVEFGQSTMQQSIALGNTAKEGILALKPLADQVTEVPTGWRSNVIDKSNFLNQGQALVGGIGQRINGPMTLEQINRMVLDMLEGRTSPGSGAPFTMLPLGRDTTFDQAHNIVAAFEGGYANNPKDRGGETIYGIASKHHPDAFTKVKALYDKGDTSSAAELARGFYHTNFWKKVYKPGMTSIEALVTYDTAVNMGPDVAQDLHTKSKGNVREMLRLRQERYDAIIKGDPTQAEFKNGWTNRLHTLKAYADRYDKETNPEFAGGKGDKVATADPAADAARLARAATDKASKSSAEELADKTKNDHAAAAARTPAPRAGDMRAAKARNDQGLNAGNTEGNKVQDKKTVFVDPRTLPTPAPATIGG